MFSRVLCTIAMVAAGACSSNLADANTGKLRVALTAQHHDVLYRLSDANLRIDGAELREVSLLGSDDSLELPLPAGPYLLTLMSGWSLLEETESGTTPVPAQLLSENPVSFFMGAGATESLAFRFALSDGTEVGPSHGTLQVGIEVAEPGPDELVPVLDPCLAGLRINEVDYDQEGSDDQEFVEILQTAPCAASLHGVALELLNGTDGSVYASVALSAAKSLSFLEHLVVADEAVLAQLPEGARGLALAGLGMQNGPDSVVLRLGDQVLDAFGYGEGAPLFETRAGVEDPGAPSVGRCPGGFDTQDNSQDFVAIAPSPGSPNGC